MNSRITFLAGFLSLVFHHSAQAQSIQIDNTTPTNPVSCSGSCTITGGITAGNNLFHSFLKFNVDAGATVNFADPGVINILSRVTGNEASNILGKLAVTGGNANLFLMNPQGIIFGQNASLDVKGSFVATTASAIEFGSNGRFNSQPVAGENLSTLTVNPSAFLFNQIAAQSIINRSQAADPFTAGKTAGLRGNDGTSLLFVGGDITFDGGKATALNGLVELAGIVGTGKLGIQYYGEIPALNSEAFQLDIGRYSHLLLANQSVINTTAALGSNFSAGGAYLQGQSVKIMGDSRINTSVFEPEDAGFVSIKAVEDITLDNSAVFSNVESGATGSAGGIILEGRSIFLNNQSELQAVVNKGGIGNAGIVIVRATEMASFDQQSGIFATIEANALGSAGGILVESKNVQLNNASSFQTLIRSGGVGNAGIILVEASGDVVLQGENTGIFSVAQVGSAGTGGGVAVEANSVDINDGAGISVSSAGTGKAGDIVVFAREDVNLNRGSITAESLQTGGGNIFVRAQNVRMRNSSLISTSVYNGTGGGGDIFLIGNDPSRSTFVALEDSDILAAAENGPGGNIFARNFPAFIYDKFAAVPKDFVNASIFRGNVRVDISASSRFGLDGSVNVPDFTFLQDAIASLAADFVSADQIVAGSCLAQRNRQRGSFVVTGTGGLPPTPYDYSPSDYRVTEVQPLPGVSERPSVDVAPPPKPQSNRPIWKLGDSIQEAQALTITAQGQIMASAAPRSISWAEDLICEGENSPP